MGYCFFEFHPLAFPRRDKPRFNPTILWSAFPSLSVLYKEDWKDITRSTSSGKPKAYLFPQAILVDRSAAFRADLTASSARTVAGAATIGDPGRYWWEPIRRQVLRFAGVEEEVLDLSLKGWGAIDPAVVDADEKLKKNLWEEVESRREVEAKGEEDVVKIITEEAIAEALEDELLEQGGSSESKDPAALIKRQTSTSLDSSSPSSTPPLITYISRQNSRRRLTPESHTDLVKALEKHSKVKGWELMIVEAEKLTKEEQLILAAKTTVSW